MEFSPLAPLVVVIACSNAQGIVGRCTALRPDPPVVTAREIVVCELRANVSRRHGAAFGASCARGARLETRSLPADRDLGATALATVFF